MSKYELHPTDDGYAISRTDGDGKVWWIPENESNADYQQYLIDTDGGLPIPEAEGA